MKKTFILLTVVFFIARANAAVHCISYNHYVTGGDSLLVDINGDGINDLLLSAFDPSGNGFTVVEGINGSKIWLSSADSLSMDSVPYTNPIDSSASGYTWVSNVSSHVCSSIQGGYCGSNFYLGVEIKASGNTYYAWVYFSPSANPFSGADTLTLISYGWNDAAGAAITAGTCGTAGISEANDAVFRAYPNPFNDIVTFDLPVPNTSGYELHVSDLSGRLIASYCQLAGPHAQISLDAAPGVYIAEFIAGETCYKTKLIKQ